MADPERNLYGNPVLKITFTTEPQDPFYNMLNILSQIMLGDETEDFQEGGKESPALSRKRQTAEYMLKRLGYSESDAKAIFDTAKGFEQNFFFTGNKAILTNGFTKKQQKTPPREIQLAKDRRDDYERHKK